MANVIRLNNGGVIQVRTGVLQGIGPRGSTGLRGPKGDPGPDGPQGETGPMGMIQQYYSKARVAATIPVSSDTDTLVSFGAVDYDDLSIFASTTNLTAGESGDYMFTCWVKFEMPANAGDGNRSLWLQSSTGGTLCRTSVAAVADEPTYLNISWPHRTAAGETLNVYARQGDDLAVGLSTGAISVVRIGSGPRGEQGPAGPQGAVGQVGPKGDPGPAGSAGSGFTTYADLLP